MNIERLKDEHRTSNIERRTKKKDGATSRFQIMELNKIKLRTEATSSFDVRRWTFDVGRLFFLIFFILLSMTGSASAEEWFTVKYVNDGDTIVLSKGTRVRYIGINSPEIDHDRQKAQPYGYAARDYNRQMVLNRKIRLEFDLERHDRYGRLLAYVFLPDGIFLNEHLLQMGYAYFLFRKPNLKYNQRLLEVQRAAMQAGQGLWNNWIEEKKRYVGNRNSMRFHLETCPQARKIKQRNRISFSTKWDAFRAGYAPAGGCIQEFWR
jgi:micrococcal nuclease